MKNNLKNCKILLFLAKKIVKFYEIQAINFFFENLKWSPIVKMIIKFDKTFIK